MSENCDESFDFEREDSLCFLSPHQLLLNALAARNLEKFKQILRSSHLNYVYEDPYNKSLLDMACSSSHCARFVKVLINSGAEIDAVNVVYKKSPLHFAIQFADFDIVQLLVDSSITNVNIRDSFGNTPLHKAAELDKADIVHLLLLQNPAIKVNLVNRKLQTPLHLAAARGSRDCALELIKDLRVDLDKLRDFGDNTCREMVNKKFPGIELPLAERIGEGDTTLFALLHGRDMNNFTERCAKNKSRVNEDDGKYTYLQYACLYGLTDAVQLLLENGANPNLTSNKQTTTPPVMIAARQGYLNIVKILIEPGKINYEPTEEGTVLHAVLDGMIQTNNVLGTSFETRKHLCCLEYLLKNVSSDSLKFNFTNGK